LTADRLLPYDLANSQGGSHGQVIPVDGGGIAVDAGTLPFDPRVAVRPELAP